MNNAELENWHDYEVGSRREIVSLLRQIGEKNQLIRMLVKGESDVAVTSILEVDDDTDTVVLDRSIDPLQNERIVAATSVTDARGMVTGISRIEPSFSGGMNSRPNGIIVCLPISATTIKLPNIAVTFR